jgi:hypothetical protein
MEEPHHEVILRKGFVKSDCMVRCKLFLHCSRGEREREKLNNIRQRFKGWMSTTKTQH